MNYQPNMPKIVRPIRRISISDSSGGSGGSWDDKETNPIDGAIANAITEGITNPLSEFLSKNLPFILVGLLALLGIVLSILAFVI